MARTDITAVATAESRRKGSYARAEALRKRKEAACREAEEQLRTHVEKAVTRLAELLDSSDERVVVQSAKEILDRVLGRPVQSVSGDVDGDPVRIILRSAFEEDEDGDARA